MRLQCIISILACTFGLSLACGKSEETQYPPEITCPSVNGQYVADRGSKCTTVSWSDPSVTDKNNDQNAPSVVGGRGSGSRFCEGEHTILYKVTDKKNNQASCFMRFSVVVRRCSYIQGIPRGTPTCNDYIYGSTCNFRCDEGYELQGASTITCGLDENWAPASPNCLAKTCPELRIPDKGIGYDCTDGVKYASICWLRCNETAGYAPPRGRWTRCGEDQRWSMANMFCEDVTPPVINNCPTALIQATKSQDSATTRVSWPTLTATDNSGEAVNVISGKAGVSPSGGLFPAGFDFVVFSAQDRAGNKAESCYVMISVTTVRCKPPKLNDDKVNTPGCLIFDEGSSCKLECYRALELKGSKYITCKKQAHGNEGYWDWGQGENASAIEPHCPYNSCPALRAPDNGVLVCDGWFLGQICSVMCNKDHDFPITWSRDNVQYTCRDDGTWSFPHVPNCSFREHGQAYRLPARYYFTGRCAYAKSEISQKFVDEVKKKGYCTDTQHCNVDNVTIKCGDEVDDFVRRRRRRRRRRQTSSSYLTFYVELSDPGITDKDFDARKSQYSQKLTDKARSIQSLEFQISDGRKFSSTVVRVGRSLMRIVCPDGLQQGAQHDTSCVPCPAGAFHNKTAEQCYACALGTYQPNKGQVECIQCDPGYTTITLATVNKTSCKEMCHAGEFSLNGIVPCTKCEKGTYQDQLGQKSCIRCPVGFSTQGVGGTSKASCVAYDILFKGPDQQNIEGKIPSSLDTFSFAIWAQIVDTAYGGIRFEVYSPITLTGIEVYLGKDVKVYIGKTNEVLVPNALNTKWNHVAATYSSKTVNIYINGNKVKTMTLPAAASPAITAESVMRVGVRDFNYLYLRDLNFVSRVFTDSEISSFVTTCDTYLRSSIFTLENLGLDSKEATKSFPSTCLRPHICEKKPCGENVCVPRNESFVCVCKGGYTGEKCEIPPDYCKQNLCANQATCTVDSSAKGYNCICAPRTRGSLCEERIEDGGWSAWQLWGDCSTSCGNGTKTRRRFCTNPPPSRDGGKDCEGPASESAPCQMPKCPECEVSTLKFGKGIARNCEKTGESIKCQVSCLLGKVFPERPFDYNCAEGIWSPTPQTVSCTDPVTPLNVGINYTVQFDDSVGSNADVAIKMKQIGSQFQCIQNGQCHMKVGSAPCTDEIKNCKDHGGDLYGSIILERAVPVGEIDVVRIQENKPVMAYLSPLFATWNVFAHNSKEMSSADHRELELSIESNKMMVNPWGDAQKFEVPGQFGNIMKQWKHVDDTNWEVRTENYSRFNMANKSPTYLSARQTMKCPEGSVQGGVFCIKCPPGKYFENGECKWCLRGFYQDTPGQFSCKHCPGLRTTEREGTSGIEFCSGEGLSSKHLLIALSSPAFTIVNIEPISYRTVSLTASTAKVEAVTFNSRTGFVYYATQKPTTIGRIHMDGTNDEVLHTFPEGTTINSLDVDVGSGLIFFTSYTSTEEHLAALHTATGAIYDILSNITQPRSLMLDQHFGIYWVESNAIKYMKYDSRVATTVIEDTHAVFDPVVTDENKLMWQSYKRLRQSDRDGSNVLTLAVDFTARFGYTDDYFYYVDSQGQIMRVNRDLKGRVNVLSLPQVGGRMAVINATDDPSVTGPCATGHNCTQGCYPRNQTVAECFCAKDYTLQKDYRTCRPDFSGSGTTPPDSTRWWKFNEYQIPPSLTLRFKVKACHSARVALTFDRNRYYRIDLGRVIDNVTEVAIRKIDNVRGVPAVVLQLKDIKGLLDCNVFKPFWLTWVKDVIKVGTGLVVGKDKLLEAFDEDPFIKDFVMFGTDPEATGYWQL